MPEPCQSSIDVYKRQLVLRVLADRSQALVASPALVGRLGHPPSPADLAQWPSLAHSAPQQHYQWTLFGPNGAQATLYHTPRLITGDMVALRAAALAGVGLAQLPTMLVRSELAQGTLVQLLPDWAPRREIIHAVYPSRRGLLPAVRALIDDLAQRFKALDED